MGDERDEFDDIVDRLDLDLPFPEPDPEAAPGPSSEPTDPAPEPVDLDDQPDPDPFYRRVPDPPARPHDPRMNAAWAAVIGSPLLAVVCSLLGVPLPRPILLGLGLIVVAGAIYLIAQLPEHGPSRPDWPDDGAAL